MDFCNFPLIFVDKNPWMVNFFLKRHGFEVDMDIQERELSDTSTYSLRVGVGTDTSTCSLRVGVRCVQAGLIRVRVQVHLF